MVEKVFFLDPYFFFLVRIHGRGREKDVYGVSRERIQITVCPTILHGFVHRVLLVFWFLTENVSDHFSSLHWKGGDIDGRVSPRTGTSEWIVLAKLCGHTSWFHLVWE